VVESEQGQGESVPATAAGGPKTLREFASGTSGKKCLAQEAIRRSKGAASGGGKDVQ